MDFFDDLNKLNKDNLDNEFSRINDQVYDEHSYILSPDKNPEFFYGLCDMCKKYYPNLPSNENGFTQEDLNKIIYIRSDFKSESYFKDVTSLDELQYFYNLKSVWVYTLINCQKLKSVIFPENLQNISSNGFYYCRSLEKVVFPENLKKIEYCAFGCTSSLKEVIFPENIQFIGENAFMYCISLEKIIIPERFKNNMKNIFLLIDLSKVDITYI